MKKLFISTLLLALSSTALAEEKFYYFAKTVDGELQYTRILRCNTTSVNSSDTTFVSANAVGPFDNYQAANAAHRITLNQARKSGHKVKLSESVCTSG